MKKMLVLLLSLLTSIVDAQLKNDSIIFIKGSSWSEILEKAKREKKPIFIDVMATWCGPCKKMDSDVYSDKDIIEVVNQKFIPVKVQIDKTPHDVDEIKRWYNDAEKLQQLYNITALPTLVFLNPDGKLQCLDIGYKDKKSFLKLIDNAITSNFAAKIDKFFNGTIDSEDMLGLSLEAKKFGLDSLANSIARSYKKECLDNKRPEDVLKEKHKIFLNSYSSLFGYGDQIFKFLYHEPKKADFLLKHDGFSRLFTDNIIKTSFVYPYVWKDGKYLDELPNWNMIEERVTKMYDPKTSHRVVLDAKVLWYYAKKNWELFIKFNMEKIALDSIPMDGVGALMLNNFIYDVVIKHSTDKATLLKCAEYMSLMIRNDPDGYANIDTYACVLYKAGQTKEAIIQEEKALRLAQRIGDKESIIEFQGKIHKIKNGLPI